VFIGLVGMIDPPREEVKSAVALAKGAGIRPIMITGDHPKTAAAIAAELDISAEGQAITGAEVERLADDALDQAVQECSVYARVNPEHKLRIVDALQRDGEVVAMTGDGVNDAPALKTADIGVAMGITGTDVSKEAADMVLTDDNFASIVAAVEEGRSIFSNIQKFLRYLLSSNIGEVITVFFGVVLSGVIIAAGTLLVLDSALPGGLIEGSGDLPYARTMAFTTLMLFQLFNVFNARSDERSAFSELFHNPWLWGALLLSLLLQVFVVYTPFLQPAFGTVGLRLEDWLLCAAVASSVLWLREASKLFARGVVRA